MNTTAWLGLWCLSVNSWSGFCVPFNARLSQADRWHESLWLRPEAPTVATSDLTTARMSTAGPTHETRHLLWLCIRGTCTHIPMRASHTSSMHISRAHKAAWALKLPLKYLFFCEHTHVTHSRIYPTHGSNVRCCQQSFWCSSLKKTQLWNQTLSLHSATSWSSAGRGGSPWSSVGLFCFHMQVFEPTYLSTHALPHIHFYLFVTTDTLHALKKKKKKDRRTRSVDRSTLLSAKH